MHDERQQRRTWAERVFEGVPGFALFAVLLAVVLFVTRGDSAAPGAFSRRPLPYGTLSSEETAVLEAVLRDGASRCQRCTGKTYYFPNELHGLPVTNGATETWAQALQIDAALVASFTAPKQGLRLDPGDVAPGPRYGDVEQSDHCVRLSRVAFGGPDNGTALLKCTVTDMGYCGMGFLVKVVRGADGAWRVADSYLVTLS